MAVEEIKDIVVMRRSIMFLRMCFIFPNKEEINQPNKHFIKFSIMYILGIYFPIGIALHMMKNINSKLTRVVFHSIL